MFWNESGLLIVLYIWLILFKGGVTAGLYIKMSSMIPNVYRQLCYVVAAQLSVTVPQGEQFAQ